MTSTVSWIRQFTKNTPKRLIWYSGGPDHQRLIEDVVPLRLKVEDFAYFTYDAKQDSIASIKNQLATETPHLRVVVIRNAQELEDVNFVLNWSARGFSQIVLVLCSTEAIPEQLMQVVKSKGFYIDAMNPTTKEHVGLLRKFLSVDEPLAERIVDRAANDPRILVRFIRLIKTAKMQLTEDLARALIPSQPKDGLALSVINKRFDDAYSAIPEEGNSYGVFYEIETHLRMIDLALEAKKQGRYFGDLSGGMSLPKKKVEAITESLKNYTSEGISQAYDSLYSSWLLADRHSPKLGIERLIMSWPR